eukprot:TRINITY_DN13678_c1_g1_i1.p1 TRINITY_DN13678_c1_g1~~TRINITY_DN13678_c1_g1_i1.p1  ORF type:complete len:131 (+),score=14.60 TRINITY_DN13678_c1_g1_i1:319-711(+)
MDTLRNARENLQAMLWPTALAFDKREPVRDWLDVPCAPGSEWIFSNSFECASLSDAPSAPEPALVQGNVVSSAGVLQLAISSPTSHGCVDAWCPERRRSGLRTTLEVTKSKYTRPTLLKRRPNVSVHSSL